MANRETVSFYVFGIHWQEMKDQEWEGKAFGFALIDPKTGRIAGDVLRIQLNNGHQYVALHFPKSPYWLVVDKPPKESVVGVQRFVLHKQSLMYLDKADRNDLKQIYAAWNQLTIPWPCLALSMEFGSPMDAYCVRNFGSRRTKVAS